MIEKSEIDEITESHWKRIGTAEHRATCLNQRLLNRRESSRGEISEDYSSTCC